MFALLTFLGSKEEFQVCDALRAQQEAGVSKQCNVPHQVCLICLGDHHVTVDVLHEESPHQTTEEVHSQCRAYLTSDGPVVIRQRSNGSYTGTSVFYSVLYVPLTLVTCTRTHRLIRRSWRWALTSWRRSVLKVYNERRSCGRFASSSRCKRCRRSSPDRNKRSGSACRPCWTRRTSDVL